MSHTLTGKIEYLAVVYMTHACSCCNCVTSSMSCTCIYPKQNPRPCLLQIKGNITYNGHTFDDFIPERTASYIDQTDTHLAELTVRETFDFAARCQGTGHKAGRSTRPCLHT